MRSILPIPYIKTVKYGIDNWQDAHTYARDINLEANYSTFSVCTHENPKSLGTIKLNMPGKHNLLNALAATTLSLDIGVPFVTIAEALESFSGVDRRFTYKGSYKGADIFDDYGHHPREIEHTLTIARRRTNKGLTVVFQPHRYSRTSKLWSQFVELFASSTIDNLIITDIYPASEAPIEGVTSQQLVADIKAKNPHMAVTHLPYEKEFATIKTKLEAELCDGDLLLLQGAGKINKLAQELL